MDIIQGQTQEEDNLKVKQRTLCTDCSEQCQLENASETKYIRTTSGIPHEILRMDKQSIEVYKKTLADGIEKDYSIRLMVVGPYGVGKTALTRRLLQEDFDINRRDSTDGIDIHVRKCKISLKTKEWKTEPLSKASEDSTTERIVKLLQSPRKDLIGSSGGGIGEKFENLAADELRTHDDSSTEKSELPETPVYKREREPSVEMLNEDFVMKGDQSASEINIGMQSGQAEVEENIHLIQLKEIIADTERQVSDDDYASVSIWDFGGQSAFYTTHQMFLSHRAIYILVINMSQHIGDIIMEDKPYFDCNEMQNLKIEDFLETWLYSVHGQSKTGRQGEPPVILVGTHRDELDPVNKGKEMESVFKAIRNRFAENDASLHFIDKDFGLSNAEIDQNLEDLRRTIINLAERQSYWGEIKPAKWIPLEKVFEKMRNKNVQILSRKELEMLTQQLPVPITNVEELELFLRYNHEVGNIMYFSVPELKDKIVLNPQFLVNALKSLITAERFCEKKKGINWRDFQEKGILTTCLLDAVWQREENQQFQENREHILGLMEHLNIIARPVVYAEDGDSPENLATQVFMKLRCNYYLVPCILKIPPPNSVLLDESEFISTHHLYIELENVAFPSAIFNRLLVGCISHWPLTRSGTQSHIFCGCGQFDVNKQHRLTMSFSHGVIVLFVTRYGEINRQPDVSICRNVHSTVKQILKRIENVLSLEIKFVEYVQCPLCKTFLGQCMHSVQTRKETDEFHRHMHRNLLEYWFDSEETNQLTVLECGELPFEHRQPGFMTLARSRDETANALLLAKRKRRRRSAASEKAAKRPKQASLREEPEKRTSRWSIEYTEDSGAEANARLSANRKTKNRRSATPEKAVKQPQQDEPKPIKLAERPEPSTKKFAFNRSSKYSCWDSMAIQMHGHDKCRVNSEECVLLINVVCLFLKNYLSEKIIHVWFGYQTSQQPVFVVIATVKTANTNLQELFKQHSPFPVIQRLPNEVSEEAKKCAEKEAGLTFSFDEHLKLREILTEHSEHLMNSHSNLLAVSASKVKFRKLGKQTDVKTCIVLYVHVKGIIPVGEQLFPEKIGQYEVDVREGVFQMYSGLKLAMGSCIGNIQSKSRGILGGFVRLNNGKLGCFTCAHVFSKCDSEREIEVHQLPCYSNKPFGKVIQNLNMTGDKENTGVDAALIEITDISRVPDEGHFRIKPGISALESFEFTSGRILTSQEQLLDLYLNKCTICKIVKYDEKNQQMYVRIGKLLIDGTSVRWRNPAYPFDECRLHRQMEIRPVDYQSVASDDKSFATFGDSGSLVFLESQTEDQAWAIGMVVGGCSDTMSAVVTPIWSILEAFKLPLHLEQFGSPRLLKMEQAIKSLDETIRSQYLQISHNVNQLIETTKQIQESLQRRTDQS